MRAGHTEIQEIIEAAESRGLLVMEWTGEEVHLAPEREEGGDIRLGGRTLIVIRGHKPLVAVRRLPSFLDE